MEKFYSRKELGELSVDELINLIMYLQDKLEILEHDLKDTRRQLEDATEDNKNLYEALVQVQKIVRPFQEVEYAILEKIDLSVCLVGSYYNCSNSAVSLVGKQRWQNPFTLGNSRYPKEENFYQGGVRWGFTKWNYLNKSSLN